MTLFTIVSDEGSGPCRRVRLDPANPDTLKPTLARKVRSSYFDTVAAENRLRRAAEELRIFTADYVLSNTDLAAALAEELDTVLPSPWNEPRPKQTDVQRSELAEIVARDVLESHFGSVVPASRIEHKEVPDQQSRGADVLALEDADNTPFIIVLSEVKGSTESVSPPGVVSAMASKLRQLLSNRRALLQELIWLRDHASDEWAKLAATACAAFQLNVPAFTLVIAPILVRSLDTAKEQDCGEFWSNPESFPCPIRFVSVTIPEDLFAFAAQVYELARSGERA